MLRREKPQLKKSNQSLVVNYANFFSSHIISIQLSIANGKQDDLLIRQINQGQRWMIMQIVTRDAKNHARIDI